MTTGSLGLHFENYPNAVGNDYSLHFEKQTPATSSAGISAFSRNSVVFVNPPLNQNLWKDWASRGILSLETLSDGVPQGESEDLTLGSKTGIHSPPSKSIDWTDVLAWSVCAAGVGAGTYFLKNGFKNQDSNQRALGGGLVTGALTWTFAEVLHRGVENGKRPPNRGALLAISLGAGALSGLGFKYAGIAPLLPASSFADQGKKNDGTSNSSQDAKNPVTPFGP